MGREIQEKGRGGRGAKEKRGNERESPNILGPIQGLLATGAAPPRPLQRPLFPAAPTAGPTAGLSGRSALCSFIVCCEGIMCKSGIDKRPPQEEERETENGCVRTTPLSILLLS